MPINAAELRHSVLCLDDDEAVLELLAAFLPRQGPFDVTTTTDPDRGVQFVTEGAADLVVSDYRMETCSGIEFLERVRSVDAELPFVMFTGHGTDEILRAARSAGATEFVRKGGTERLDTLVSTLTAVSDRT